MEVSFCKKKLWISTWSEPGVVLFNTLKDELEGTKFLPVKNCCMRWSVKWQIKFSGGKKKQNKHREKQSQHHIKTTGSELTALSLMKKKYCCYDRYFHGIVTLVLF